MPVLTFQRRRIYLKNWGWSPPQLPARADDSCLVNWTGWGSLVSTAGATPTDAHPAGTCHAICRDYDAGRRIFQPTTLYLSPWALAAHGLEVLTTTMGQREIGPGLQDAIDEEIASFEAAQKQKAEDNEAAEKQLQKAARRQRTSAMKSSFPCSMTCDDAFAAEGKVLPALEICPDGKIDEFRGTAVTPSVDARDVPVGCYTIEAGASVAEHGVLLDLSVECSITIRTTPRQTRARNSTSENVVVMVLRFETQWSKDKMYAMAGQKHAAFDKQRTREWFQEQLRDSAKKCVRTELEQVATNEPSTEAAGTPPTADD